MYDFTTKPDRSRMGSTKWHGMTVRDPNVPAGIVPFSIADMELVHPPELVQGLADFMQQAILGYTIGTPEYKAAVGGWMDRRHGWHIEPEWIVETSGVVPALFSAVRAYTEPGDGVILLTPVYGPFFRAVTLNDRTVVECPLKRRDGRYHIDFDHLEQLAKNPTNTLIIFCSPHNPVGRVWTREEVERVGRICLRHGVQVVSDEIHFDLVMPGRRHTVYASISEEFLETSVICTAPSKTFNLPGLQISNIIIQNAELRKRFVLEQEKTGFSSCNVVGYEACRLAYTRCEEWLRELIDHIDGNRQAVEAFIQTNIPEITVYPLEATYLQWWDCRRLGMEPRDLDRFLAQEARLFLERGHIFGRDGEGFQRVNLACPRQVLLDALERLNAALKRKRASSGKAS